MATWLLYNGYVVACLGGYVSVDYSEYYGDGDIPESGDFN